MSPLTSTDIEAIQQLLVQAGEIALHGLSAAAVSYKADHTPFTDVELAMEAHIIGFIESRFPGDQLITEENGSRGAPSGRVWALDPIDGTKVYLNGLPTWGVSLGLLVEGQPEAGFFYLPRTHDFYWADSSRGAFLNTVRLSSRVKGQFDDPLAFLAVPTNVHRYYQVDYPRIRALGSTAAHLCYVAQGAAAGALTRRINLWDIAGVLPILAQTGVQVEFLSGQSFSAADYLDGRRLPEELLAAPPNLLPDLRSAIQRK